MLERQLSMTAEGGVELLLLLLLPGQLVLLQPLERAGAEEGSEVGRQVQVKRLLLL